MPIGINGTGSITGITAGGLPDAVITADDIAAGAVTQAKRSEQLTLDTARTATGTAVDFTGIPSWARRITVMFSGVSVSGTSPIMVRLGTGATVYTTSGYLGSTDIASTSVNFSNLVDGFLITDSNAASNVFHGIMTLANVTGNTWVAQSMAGTSNSAQLGLMGGSIPLAAALTAVRVTTVNGTDTFDAGTINIMYE
jgi:hypothetical protein